MRKFGWMACGILCLTFTVAGLTGCDLLRDWGHKKQDEKKQPVAEGSLPAASQSAKQTQGSLPKDVLARVGDWTLTTNEFNERLKLLKQGLPDFKENDANSSSYRY